MKQTLSILYAVEESNLNKQTGLTPIICNLTVNGERTRFRTPMKVTVREFRTMMNQRANNYIKDFTAEITNQLYEAQNELMRQGITVTAANIRDLWRNGRLKGCSLSRLWAEFIKSLKLRVGVSFDNDDGKCIRSFFLCEECWLSRIAIVDSMKLAGTAMCLRQRPEALWCP